MYEIGPHHFTEMDARRTVENFDFLWGGLVAGRDAGAVAHLRPELTGDIATDLGPVWKALTSVGPELRADGQMPATATGTVVQINSSNGGVPKLPVPSATVGWTGLEGDVQRVRRHHGRPWQALCIWSGEVIDSFRNYGHPIFEGAAGENITVRGLPWGDVRPGVRLRVGTVLCEVSAYALPCKSNAQWFRNGDFNLMHHEQGDVSRVYATVLKPGKVSEGDEAILEP